MRDKELMQKGLAKLYAGNFNYMSQQWQKDGSVIVTLCSEGDDVSYEFHARNLYGPDEEVLEHKALAIPGQREISAKTELARKSLGV